jgi:trk system potassium uptake protein TrkA
MRVILIGSGKLVYFLARDFISKGYKLSIITSDEKQAVGLSRKLEATVLLGEGSDSKILQEAGAYRADVILALTPYDQNNLIACQIAQKEYNVPRTVTLVNDPDNKEIFKQLGITVAFSTTEVIAQLIEQQTITEEIKTLFPVAEGEASVTEVVLPQGSPAIGQRLKDLALPSGTLIACIIRQGKVTVPAGLTQLQANDRLVLISEPEGYGPLLRILVGEEE